MGRALKAWVKAVEAAQVTGAVCLALFLGVALGWLHDSNPLFTENPDLTSQFVENARVHAGDWIVTHRSMMRTDDCAVRAGVWIADRDGNLLYHIDDYTSFAGPYPTFRESRVAFQVPLGVMPGKYEERVYVVCQKNPLVENSQALRPLLFVVVPAGEPL